MTAGVRVRGSSTGQASGFGPRRVALTAALAIALVGCSGSTSPTATAGAVTTRGPLGSGDPTRAPSATNWPTLVIEGAISLAAANGNFSQMNQDVTAAVNAADPARIRTVMQDVLTFLKANRVAVGYLQQYDTTKPTGDRLAVAYDQMIGGAQAIVDGTTSGNGAAVQSGFNDFYAGDAAYAALTGALGDIAAQATLMKRGYTQ
ncbi:MAG: hypothetical protein HY262_06385 [Chloroflexi bacterium]|nr:hypothetical protein [Chloroflexota bacterium]